VAAYVHGESGLDGPDLPPPSRPPDGRHAVELLADTLHASERPITLVPTGPLTNVALLLALHPGIVERIERVVLMGGAIAEGNVTPAAEFNIWADPEAARRVFESGLDLTMVGLDVTHKALVGDVEAERMRAAGRAGGIVADLLGFYGRYHREQYGWAGSPIHDAVAVAQAARPDLLETKFRHVDVDCSWELSRGRTLVDLWERTGKPANCHVATGIDAAGFVELLVERISSLG
jgi:inosine-uridine nucleoside N-ribohydrolase